MTVDPRHMAAAPQLIYCERRRSWFVSASAVLGGLPLTPVMAADIAELFKREMPYLPDAGFNPCHTARPAWHCQLSELATLASLYNIQKRLPYAAPVMDASAAAAGAPS